MPPSYTVEGTDDGKYVRFGWLYVIVFLADMTYGSLVSTLPLYAQALGASFFVVSAISASSSVLRIFFGPYFGHLSDRVGSKKISLVGLSCFTIFPLLLVGTSDPRLIVLEAGLLGVSLTIFTMASVYVATGASPQSLDRVMGINMMSQGLGYTIGPIVGAYIVQNLGFHFNYAFSAAISATGLAIAFVKLKSVKMAPRADHSPLLGRLKLSLGNPGILSVGVLSLLMTLAMSVSYTFFPLLGVAIGIPYAQIGAILGLRALCSTLVRIPTGNLSSRIGGARLLLFSLILAVLADAFLTLGRSVLVLSIAVVLEGIGFGVYLTVSRVVIGATTSSSDVGLSMGVLDMFTSTGTVLLLPVLGELAQLEGLRAAFAAACIIFIVGGAGPIHWLFKAGERHQRA